MTNAFILPAIAPMAERKKIIQRVIACALQTQTKGRSIGGIQAKMRAYLG
jgi:hypothetical protein